MRGGRGHRGLGTIQDDDDPPAVGIDDGPDVFSLWMGGVEKTDPAGRLRGGNLSVILT